MPVRPSSRLAGALGALGALACAAALAQPRPYEGQPEKLGSVSFPVSCTGAAQQHFTRGVALYHSYYFPEARKAFAAARQADASCAMAHWGEAIIEIGNAFAWPTRGQALAAGQQAIERAQALDAKTRRERDFIAAVGAYFADPAKVPARTRQLAYELALEKMTRDYPDDQEVAIFHAHVLSANFDPNDKKYGNQLRAAEILEKLYAALPDHPGVAHYLIHSYDFPPLAQRALPAAMRYRTIAPSAPHALHMPSHTFTRLGLWKESIASNQAVLDVPGVDMVSRLHSLDYMAYAYLQLGQNRAAERVLGEIRAITSKIEGDTLFGAAFALAAIPARITLEQGRWADAARLTLQPDELAFNWQQFPQAQAVTFFARGIGAARAGDAQGARREIQRLAALRSEMTAGGLHYWADQAAIQIKAVEAWALRAEARTDEALAAMRAAADHEDATDKAAVTPGPVKPARELLAEMLAEAKQPAAALAEFELAIGKEPGRYRALLGAARAADAMGDRARARRHYRELAKQWDSADGDAPEFADVRRAAN